MGPTHTIRKYSFCAQLSVLVPCPPWFSILLRGDGSHTFSAYICAISLPAALSCRTKHEDSIFVFGGTAWSLSLQVYTSVYINNLGYDGVQRMNDLYEYRCDLNVWKQVLARGIAPRSPPPSSLTTWVGVYTLLFIFVQSALFSRLFNVWEYNVRLWRL